MSFGIGSRMLLISHSVQY